MSFNVYKIDILSDSDFVLTKALEIVFERDTETVKGYKIDPEKGFIFYWYWATGSEVNEFPLPLRAEELKPIISKWLKTAEYSREGTGDGTYKKGWRLYNKGIDSYATFAIKPEWTYYSK